MIILPIHVHKQLDPPPVSIGGLAGIGIYELDKRFGGLEHEESSSLFFF